MVNKNHTENQRLNNTNTIKSRANSGVVEGLAVHI
jgi:hypothetical protein